MDTKEAIKTLLESLETEGLSRTEIEKQLGYSENSIDQLLSRGGNDKFKRVLEIVLRKTILEKEIEVLKSEKPVKARGLEIKKHLDSLLEQAGAMKRIIDESLNSGDPQKKSENTLPSQGERKRLPGDQPRRTTDDKSKVPGRQNGRGNTPAKGKLNKG